MNPENAHKKFPGKLFLRAVVSPCGPTFLASEDIADLRNDGEMVAIYELARIQRLKITKVLKD